MTSDEAIRIFLSRNPVKFTISDIASALGYHRNTTKKAIKRIDDVSFIGSGNYTNYFIKSMMDHYREIGEAVKVAYDSNPLNEPLKFFEHIRAFGYALVKENLEATITDEYVENYNHEKLEDSLIHLKMSYPFENIIEVKQEDGSTEIRSSVKFYLVRDGLPGTTLRVDPCLCLGNMDEAYLCEMAAGGLQAGLNFACQMFDTKIIHIECDVEGSCNFQITRIETTEEDETALDDFL